MSGESCSCGGSCGCGNHSSEATEVHLTREEYIVRLEQYMKDLKTEIEAVEAELLTLREPV